MRWFGGRDEENPIKPAMVKHMPGQGQMTLMHGIECPAEQAYPLMVFTEGHVSGADLAVAKNNKFLSG